MARGGSGTTGAPRGEAGTAGAGASTVAGATRGGERGSGGSALARESEEERNREMKGGPIRKTGLGAKIHDTELGAKIHGAELAAMLASTPSTWPRPRCQNLWRQDV